MYAPFGGFFICRSWGSDCWRNPAFYRDFMPISVKIALIYHFQTSNFSWAEMFSVFRNAGVVHAVVLFPKVKDQRFLLTKIGKECAFFLLERIVDSLKTPMAEESYNSDGLRGGGVFYENEDSIFITFSFVFESLEIILKSFTFWNCVQCIQFAHFLFSILCAPKNVSLFWKDIFRSKWRLFVRRTRVSSAI